MTGVLPAMQHLTGSYRKQVRVLIETLFEKYDKRIIKNSDTLIFFTHIIR